MVFIDYDRQRRKWYYLTQSLEDKKIQTFLKGICTKVNVIAEKT